jgi:hypothetical protein
MHLIFGRCHVPTYYSIPIFGLFASIWRRLLAAGLAVQHAQEVATMNFFYFCFSMALLRQKQGISNALLQVVRVRVGNARTFSMASEGGTEVASKSALMKLSKSDLAKRLGQIFTQVRGLKTLFYFLPVPEWLRLVHATATA